MKLKKPRKSREKKKYENRRVNRNRLCYMRSLMSSSYSITMLGDAFGSYSLSIKDLK